MVCIRQLINKLCLIFPPYSNLWWREMTIIELGFWGLPWWHRISPWLCLLLVRSYGQPSNSKPLPRRTGPCFLLTSNRWYWLANGLPARHDAFSCTKAVRSFFYRSLNLFCALSSLDTYTSILTLHERSSCSKSVSRTHSQQTQKPVVFFRFSSFPALLTHSHFISPIDRLTIDTCCLC